MDIVKTNLIPRAKFTENRTSKKSMRTAFDETIKIAKEKPPEKSKETHKLSYEQEADKIARSLNIDSDDKQVYTFGAVVDWGSTDITPIIDNLVTVMHELTDIVLYPFQLVFARRIIESVLLNDGDEITALFARQSGKSETVADVVAVLMTMLPFLAEHFPQLQQFKGGFFVGIFAPTDALAKIIGSRLNTRLSGEKAQEFFKDPALGLVYTSLTLSNGSFARIHTAAPQSKIEGHTYHLAILDEAQSLSEEKVTKSIHPMAAATNGTLVKLGTPIPQNCEFYAAIKRNLSLIASSKKRNHFEFDYKIVSKYNDRYGNFIKKEIERYGIDNDYFRMSYGLEWLLDQGMCLTEKEFNVRMKTPKGFEFDPEPNARYVAGLDLGKKFDSTVLTILKLTRQTNQQFTQMTKMINQEDREKDNIDDDLKAVVEADYYIKEVVNWYEYTRDNWQAQIINLSSVIKDHGGILCVTVDATGPGDMPFETLQSKLSWTETEVMPLIFSQKSNHLLSQIFYKNLNYKNIKVPCSQAAKKTRRWKKFHSQLLGAIKIWKNNHMHLTHPPIKGAKDDYLQSLLLALYTAEHSLNNGSVSMSDNIFYTAGGGEEGNTSSITQTAKFSDNYENLGAQEIRQHYHQGTLNTVASFQNK